MNFAVKNSSVERTIYRPWMVVSRWACLSIWIHHDRLITIILLISYSPMTSFTPLKTY